MTLLTFEKVHETLTLLITLLITIEKSCQQDILRTA